MKIQTEPPGLETATIANGQSLSDGRQVKGGLVGIIVPAAWTAAAISFQASVDGVNYFDLYDGATERSIASASIPTAAQRFLALPLGDWLGVNWIKIRSGLSGAPVPQGAVRAIGLVYAG